MASKSATAARIGNAQQSIEATMAAIATKLGIELPARPGIPLRDPAIKAAYHTERVDAFLKSVAAEIKAEVANESESPAADATEQEPEEPAEVPTGEDLDALTVIELKDRAKDKGIKGYGSMHKAELIDALKGA